MKVHFRRHLAVVCSLALVLGSFALAPKAVVLADGETEWTETDSIPTESGSYILMNDVEIDHAFTIEDNQDVTLDLNGHSITQTGNERIYTLRPSNTKKSASLTILDSSDEETGALIGGEELFADPDTNNRQSSRGGLVYVSQNCTFTLESGTLKNGHASSGQQNLAGVGGAVYCEGKFYMEGGTIKDCTASAGGAICVAKNSSTSVEVHISGGTITGNTAETFGSAILVTGGQLGKKDNPLKISGSVVISENTCLCLQSFSNNAGAGDKYIGGAITTDKAVISISISGTGSDIIINGNNCSYSPSDSRNNIYLPDSNRTIEISGTFGENTSIGIGRHLSNVEDDIATKFQSSISESMFTSDNAGYRATIYTKGKNHYLHLSEISVPKITGYNVSISGDIRLHTYVSVPDGYDLDKLTITSYYAYDDNNFGFTENSQTYSTEKGNLTMNASGIVDITTAVEAACMTAPITFTLSYEGEEIQTAEISINRYANTLIHMENTTEQVKNILEKLLVYGYHAQKHFQINTENLPVCDQITDWAPSGTLEAQSFDSFKSLPEYVASSVVFLTTCQIKFYFTKDMNLQVSYDNEETWHPVTPTQSGSYFIYTLTGPNGDGFYATGYDVMPHIALFDGEGVQRVYSDASFSVLTYLQAVKAKNPSETMVNLAEAYYDFAESLK